MSTIARIEAFVLPYVERNDHDSTRWACYVRIESADGVVGWGEAATIFEAAARATAATVESWAPTLIGHESNPATVTAELEAACWWYGDTGIARFALSAIDIALWDLTLRADGAPLSSALPSATQSIPALLSLHATRADLDEMAAEIAEGVKTHHTIGAKVAYGKRGNAALGVEIDRDLRFMRVLREALGPRARIMIDVAATLHWTVDEAIERVRGFEEHGLAWIEEPLGADDPAGYLALREAVDSPLAYGEREWSPRGYQRIAATGTLDVAGIDPGRIGGITAVNASIRTLEATGVQGNAHAFAGPILLACAVPLSLSSDAFHQLEVTPQRNSLFDLAEQAPAPTDGLFTASESPGLGLIIDDAEVRRLAATAR